MKGFYATQGTGSSKDGGTIVLFSYSCPQAMMGKAGAYPLDLLPLLQPSDSPHHHVAPQSRSTDLCPLTYGSGSGAEMDGKGPAHPPLLSASCSSNICIGLLALFTQPSKTFGELETNHRFAHSLFFVWFHFYLAVSVHLHCLNTVGAFSNQNGKQ